jgi:hypothetical protein
MITIDWNPSQARLRRFAALLAAFIAAAGAVLDRRTGGWVLPAAVAAAALVGAVGWLRPAWLRPVYLAGVLAGFPFGWLLSHLVLAVLFYLVLTPIGLVLRLCRRDPLQRRFDPAAASYWTRRPPEGPTGRYFRQF